MDISLQDLMSLNFFTETKVLAGEKGISRIVSSVTVLETPFIAQYINGGEFVITISYGLLEDESFLEKVIQELYEKGASAIGVKLKYLDKGLPKIMEDCANKLGFPIISLPDKISYVELSNYIKSNMYARTTKEIKSIDSVHKEITKSISEEGITGLIKTLNKWTGLQVGTLFNREASYYPEEMNISLVNLSWYRVDEIQDNHLTIDKYYVRHGEISYEFLAKRILNKSNEDIYILLLKGKRDFLKSDYSLLDYVGSVYEIELERKNSQFDIETKYNHCLVKSLLGGEYLWNEAQYVLARLDYKLNQESILITVSFANTKPLSDVRCFESAQNLIKKIFGEKTLSGLIENDKIVIFLYKDLDDHKLLVQKLYDELFEIFDTVDFIIGIGRPAKFSDLRECYKEALSAIEIGMALNIKPSIYYFNDLGFYRLLKAENLEKESKKYIEDYLTNIKDNEVLMETLEIYIESGYNCRETARVMYLHPNTVRYRVSQIEKLCRVNFNYASDRLNMEIALKLVYLLPNK